jgi:hypothetical protein
MRCFYHSTIEAVAICKNCSKGLCAECAFEVVNGIACKGKCEAEVLALNEMIQRGKKSGQIIDESRERTAQSYKRTAGTYTSTGIFMGLLGLYFAVRGLMSWANGNGWGYSVFIGLIFLLWGLFSLLTAMKYRRIK